MCVPVAVTLRWKVEAGGSPDTQRTELDGHNEQKQMLPQQGGNSEPTLKRVLWPLQSITARTHTHIHIHEHTLTHNGCCWHITDYSPVNRQGKTAHEWCKRYCLHVISESEKLHKRWHRLPKTMTEASEWNYFFFLWVYVYVCMECAHGCPQRSEEGVRSARARVLGSLSLNLGAGNEA